MFLINQPKSERLGDRLNEILKKDNPDFDNFTIVAAYARRRGVLSLVTSLKKFKKNGGRFNAIVGIDQKNTSVQALELLNGTAETLHVYFNENPSITFHPKFYFFDSGNNNNALLFLGSNNLTYGGLFLNYEMSIEKPLDPNIAEDKKVYNDTLKMIGSYSNSSNSCCVKVTKKVIKDLLKEKYVIDEDTIAKSYFKQYKSRKSKNKLFGAESFPIPKIEIFEEKDEIANEVTGISTYESGFWKKLSKFDVSTTSGPGQILIPKRYLLQLPPMDNFIKMQNKAKQAEVFYNIIFVDSDGKKTRINNVRTIHYFPAPTHPRPNDELRFTFRNRTIFNKLSEGDILEFKKTDSLDVWFVIRLIKSGKDENNRLVAGNKKFSSI
jgi:HKD family nuclease